MSKERRLHVLRIMALMCFFLAMIAAVMLSAAFIVEAIERMCR